MRPMTSNRSLGRIGLQDEISCADCLPLLRQTPTLLVASHQDCAHCLSHAARTVHACDNRFALEPQVRIL
jgi:hypothetical protein